MCHRVVVRSPVQLPLTSSPTRSHRHRRRLPRCVNRRHTPLHSIACKVLVENAAATLVLPCHGGGGKRSAINFDHRSPRSTFTDHRRGWEFVRVRLASASASSWGTTSVIIEPKGTGRRGGQIQVAGSATAELIRRSGLHPSSIATIHRRAVDHVNALLSATLDDATDVRPSSKIERDRWCRGWRAEAAEPVVAGPRSTTVGARPTSHNQCTPDIPCPGVLVPVAIARTTIGTRLRVANDSAFGCNCDLQAPTSARPPAITPSITEGFWSTRSPVAPVSSRTVFARPRHTPECLRTLGEGGPNQEVVAAVFVGSAVRIQPRYQGR